jgi:hypothetical protein
LKAEGRELGFDFAQLTELRVAVGSPAAAIENQQRPFLSHRPGEFDRFALYGRQIHRGNPSTGRQRLRVFG